MDKLLTMSNKEITRLEVMQLDMQLGFCFIPMESDIELIVKFEFHTLPLNPFTIGLT